MNRHIPGDADDQSAQSINRRLLTCGEHAVLVELDGLEEVLALNTAVQAAVQADDPAFADVVDIVPAARTLLVTVREGSPLTPVRQALAEPSMLDTSGTNADADTPATSPVVEILVRYDGPDLGDVAGLTGLTPDEVIAAHTGTPWRVAFTGFSPGFSYLFGGDPRLQVPRRSEPRTRVPAGSVGLAGEFSAVYPRSSPGGWQLLGHTDAIFWDVDRQPPALLQPGFEVCFVDADAASDHSHHDPDVDAGAASR